MRRDQQARENRSRARGRALLRLTVGVAAALAIAIVAWPGGADAQDAAVTARKAAARRARGGHRKAAEVERLRRIDSSAARAAIKALADDAGDATAMTAIGALCREDFSGARAKLKSIFEDEDRSDVVRSTAIVALLHLRDADGASWGNVRSYVRSHTSAGDDVRKAALAAARKHWGSAVSDA